MVEALFPGSMETLLAAAAEHKISVVFYLKSTSFGKTKVKPNLEISLFICCHIQSKIIKAWRSKSKRLIPFLHKEKTVTHNEDIGLSCSWQASSALETQRNRDLNYANISSSLVIKAEVTNERMEGEYFYYDSCSLVTLSSRKL